MDGDICRVVEKEEDQFYLETLDLKIPTTFEVQAPESMKVSESDKLICTTEGSCKMDYTYESSDPNIVSVDETGGLNAWKAGTATITITAETIGVTKQVTITVDGSQYEDAEVFSKVNGGSSIRQHSSAALFFLLWKYHEVLSGTDSRRRICSVQNIQ